MKNITLAIDENDLIEYGYDGNDIRNYILTLLAILVKKDKIQNTKKELMKIVDLYNECQRAAVTLMCAKPDYDRSLRETTKQIFEKAELNSWQIPYEDIFSDYMIPIYDENHNVIDYGIVQVMN